MKCTASDVGQTLRSQQDESLMYYIRLTNAHVVSAFILHDLSKMSLLLKTREAKWCIDFS